MTLLLLRHTSKRALYGTACTENLLTTESPYPDQKAPSINFLIPSILLFVPAYDWAIARSASLVRPIMELSDIRLEETSAGEVGFPAGPSLLSFPAIQSSPVICLARSTPFDAPR